MSDPNPIRNVWLLLLLMGSIFPTTLPGQRAIYNGTPFISIYDVSTSDAGAVNLDIAQDQRGAIYFASGYGLRKFDGVHWEFLQVSVGLAAVSLHIDKDRIYVGSQNEFGYFEPDEQSTLTYYSLSEQLQEHPPKSDIYRIIKHKEEVYFLSFDYVYILGPDGIRSIPISDYQAITTLYKGGLVLSQKGEGLFLLKGNSRELLTDLPGLSGVNIREICPLNKEQSLIFTVSSGIYLLDNGVARYWRLSDPDLLTSSEISTVIRLQNGDYLIGTDNKGILRINAEGKLVATYDQAVGLRSNMVQSLFQDKSGNIWVGHNNGISEIYLSSPFSLVDETLGVSGFGNTAIKFEGQLFLGTSTGLYRYVPEERTYHFVENSKGKVLDLKRFQNRLVVGHHRGVFVYQNNKLELVDEVNHDEPSWEGVWKIMPVPDHPDRMLIGGYAGLRTLKMNSEGVFYVSEIAGFNEACRVMEFDDFGNLWVTHGLKGIFQLQLDVDRDSISSFVLHRDMEVFSSNFHINVFKVNNEIVFTGNTGIFQFDQETQQFEVASSFSTSFPDHYHIRELEEDHVGNIYYWAGEESGVLKSAANDAVSREKEPFFQISDLVDDGIIDFTFVDPQNLFLGASEGFLHINPATYTYEPDSFHLYVREVALIGERDSSVYRVGYGEPAPRYINIDYGSNAIRFSSSAVYYFYNEVLEYSYYLKNLDKGWSAWTYKHEREYINLPPGSYTFMVKARNIFQVESKVERFNFTILPPWYRTALAYVVYTILGLVALLLFYLRIRFTYTQEKQQIERQNLAEIHQKESQIAEIEKSKTEEIVRLKNEKLESEINHKNKELASSTLHLINKNQLLSEIKENLVSTQSTQDIGELNQKIKGLINKINLSIAQDADWEKFEFHFDRVHGEFSRRLQSKHQNLSPQDLKIAAYLRMNLSSKEIAQLLNISLRGVEKARYRLRKKLDLATGENLTEYVLNL